MLCQASSCPVRLLQGPLTLCLHLRAPKRLHVPWLLCSCSRRNPSPCMQVLNGRAVEGAELADLIERMIAALNARDIPTAGSILEHFNQASQRGHGCTPAAAAAACWGSPPAGPDRCSVQHGRAAQLRALPAAARGSSAALGWQELAGKVREGYAAQLGALALPVTEEALAAAAEQAQGAALSRSASSHLQRTCS